MSYIAYCFLIRSKRLFLNVSQQSMLLCILTYVRILGDSCYTYCIWTNTDNDIYFTMYVLKFKELNFIIKYFMCVIDETN